MIREASKQKNIPAQPMRFVLYCVRHHTFMACVAVLFACTAALTGQGLNYFFKIIVDSAQAGHVDRVVFFALLYPGMHFCTQMLYRASGFFGATVSVSIKKIAHDTLVDYLFHQSQTYFSNRFAGSLLTKIRNVVSAIDLLVPEVLWTYIPAIVSFSFTTSVIFSVDLISGTLFLLLVVMLVLVNRLFSAKKKILSYQASETSTRLSGATVDVLTNISAVRQYVHIDGEIEDNQRLTTEWRDRAKANWQYSEKMLTANTFCIALFSVPIFYYLVLRWSEGVMTTGFFVFIIALYAQMLHTLLFIGRAFNQAARSFGELEEGLVDILKKYDVVDTTSAQPLVVREGHIAWNDVVFVYGDNKNEVVFDHFNLAIKAGERIGLVGTSGAGKSTFVSLLLRLYDISAGEICIDGQNIREVTQHSLRTHIAVVPQEPVLFHRTIRENIAYGKLRATDEEIIEVAKKAEAHDFISTLPKGYDTLVGERGIKLSGGQKQRVAIARAMLKDAPILILDEATSALDSESEVAIQKALHVLMEGKTVIAIAHRLSTLREMDRIIVLEKGTIIEDGSHQSLVKRKGLYARLWEHQAGGFLAE